MICQEKGAWAMKSCSSLFAICTWVARKRGQTSAKLGNCRKWKVGQQKRNSVSSFGWLVAMWSNGWLQVKPLIVTRAPYCILRYGELDGEWITQLQFTSGAAVAIDMSYHTSPLPTVSLDSFNLFLSFKSAVCGQYLTR